MFDLYFLSIPFDLSLDWLPNLSGPFCMQASNNDFSIARNLNFATLKLRYPV